jgi:hypothetical protein
LEGIIQENIGGFYEVGHALAKIRDQGYYRDVLGFETFEEYCKEEMGLQARPCLPSHRFGKGS